MGFGSNCPLPWNADPDKPTGQDMDRQCPYGNLAVGGVTVPNGAGTLQWICVFYGFLPFVLITLIAIKLMVNGYRQKMAGRIVHIREASFLIWIAVMLIINELILKRILHGRRPDESCNWSCGMPSGHSCSAIGMWTLAMLDALFRTYALSGSLSPSLPTSLPATAESEESPSSAYARVSVGDLLGGVPMERLKEENITWSQFSIVALWWTLMLVPVPFSRTVLRDHTVNQCLIGSTLGMTSAIIWFFFIRTYTLRHPGFRQAQQLDTNPVSPSDSDSQDQQLTASDHKNV